MRYWFDTEFIERGPEYPIRLLSIGIVAEDGREFYAEAAHASALISLDFDNFGDSWLRDNVLPHLRGGRSELRRADMSEAIRSFCGPSEFGKPEFWAYYADYDWVVLCQIFGRMIDLPKDWPMYCRDLKQLLDEKNIRVAKQDETQEHSAINDARWVRYAWHKVVSES